MRAYSFVGARFPAPLSWQGIAKGVADSYVRLPLQEDADSKSKSKHHNDQQRDALGEFIAVYVHRFPPARLSRTFSGQPSMIAAKPPRFEICHLLLTTHGCAFPFLEPFANDLHRCQQRMV